MKPPSWSGSIPLLVSSPERFTSTSTAVSGRLCFESCSIADSEASEWISRTSGRIPFTLRLWRLPMKSQVKRSPQRSCFASRS